jgi:Ca2+-binding EF-hand superfamily protein
MNEELSEVFKIFDRNNDGLLQYNELVEGYKHLLGSIEAAKIEADMVFDKLNYSK